MRAQEKGGEGEWGVEEARYDVLCVWIAMCDWCAIGVEAQKREKIERERERERANLCLQ